MLEPLVSLMSRFGACSARISGDRQTHTHTDTQSSTVTLAAHACQGTKGTKVLTLGTLGTHGEKCKQHTFMHAWILLGWTLEPFCTRYSQKQNGIVVLIIA